MTNTPRKAFGQCMRVCVLYCMIRAAGGENVDRWASATGPCGELAIKEPRYAPGTAQAEAGDPHWVLPLWVSVWTGHTRADGGTERETETPPVRARGWVVRLSSLNALIWDWLWQVGEGRAGGWLRWR